MSLRTERGLNLVLWCGAVLAIGLFCYGAAANANQINLDIDRVDQAAYLTYARNLYKTAYHYVGGRNRMPIYPFLLSWIYNFDLSDNEFFIRAKYFNIALSAALLPGIFFLSPAKASPASGNQSLADHHVYSFYVSSWICAGRATILCAKFLLFFNRLAIAQTAKLVA
jgi:hypothetical protein